MCLAAVVILLLLRSTLGLREWEVYSVFSVMGVGSDKQRVPWCAELTFVEEDTHPHPPPLSLVFTLLPCLGLGLPPRSAPRLRLTDRVGRPQVRTMCVWACVWLNYSRSDYTECEDAIDGILLAYCYHLEVSFVSDYQCKEKKNVLVVCMCREGLAALSYSTYIRTTDVALQSALPLFSSSFYSTFTYPSIRMQRSWASFGAERGGYVR